MTSKLWYLKQIDLFSELSDKEIQEIASLSRMEAVKRGKIVYFPEDPSDSVYLLKEGRVKVSRLSEDGKEVTLAILKPGELFGELALANEGPRETIAEAIDDSLLCVINKADFERTIKRKPDLALKVFKLVGLRLRRLETKVEELVFRSAPSRLAQLLIRLAKEYGRPSQDGIMLCLSLTHREFANLIGSTRETVTLVLNDFRRQGMIEIYRRRILIRKEKELERIV